MTSPTTTPDQPRVILPEKRYAGYIFDLDGTLVDSMATHYRAWRWALRESGAPHEAFLWDEFIAHGGMAAPDIVEDLNARYGLHMDAQLTATRKRERYDFLLQTEQLPVIPETVSLVRRLCAEGIPHAIGTGSVPAGALATMRSAGIEDLFDIVVTPDDVGPGAASLSRISFCSARSAWAFAPRTASSSRMRIPESVQRRPAAWTTCASARRRASRSEV